MHLVFVYGTLRDGNPATHTLADYAMYDYGKFPYIVEEAGARVHGNIGTVDDKELTALDKYEGVERGLYTRRSVTVTQDESGERQQAFAYIGGNIHPRLIPSGDWLNRETS
jgi:gamma-glutamylcyclotransferase (GGCT)/AIG2-like uncharacterized protein YtfP